MGQATGVGLIPGLCIKIKLFRLSIKIYKVLNVIFLGVNISVSLDDIESARGQEIRMNGDRDELLHQVNAVGLPHLVVQALETGFQRLRMGRMYQVAILRIALGAVFVYSVNI